MVLLLFMKAECRLDQADLDVGRIWFHPLRGFTAVIWTIAKIYIDDCQLRPYGGSH